MSDEDVNTPHRRAWHAIPWVVNGTASRADQALVLDHVATCADCRDELALQRGLQADVAQGESAPLHDAGPALAQLWHRIEQEDALAPPMTELASPTGGRWTRWLIAAVVVQAVGLTALIGLQWAQRGASEYVTLSQAPTSTDRAAIRMVPAPALRQDELQALLKALGLRIVEVNDDGSILGLAPFANDGRALSDTVARLRANAGVLLAEPILASGVTPSAGPH